MNKNLKCLSYVLRHKWFVFYAGLRTKAPLWRLIIHDWSKFSKIEWVAYTNFFYGDKSVDDKREFIKAFNHHIHLNKHHWEYWVNVKTGKPFDMPFKYMLEMVADWMGAGRAITGKWEVREWYDQNKDRMILSPYTRSIVESILRTTNVPGEGKLV